MEEKSVFKIMLIRNDKKFLNYIKILGAKIKMGINFVTS